jgi:hypothetical protein
MNPIIALANGGHFNIEHPEQSLVRIEDIAASLSKLCRFTGHCQNFYSVAEHSVRVSELVPPSMALAGLLHDAAESIVGDMSSPLQHMLPEYKAIEARVERHLFWVLGVQDYLYPTMHPDIKRADLVMLATEKRDLLPDEGNAYWAILQGIEPVTQRVQCLPPNHAHFQFMARYEKLTQDAYFRFMARDEKLTQEER